ncbi:hypothetical protein QQM39_21145 [Streptomyces sp. DT2A-34]|uniref:hypothetical protein n=1 Tax=Streptomyces sp. DT2A-34 TaxID=3051182 RepID=UPI00265C81E4|nr:hypothetical protein [Streptomyces sp. DT2A-34]MDO0913260.1 hypothetical protein [Streptomyces sp. DT2A-34]
MPAAARQAAALADRDQATDPRAGMLLSVAARRLAPLPESRQALLDAQAGPERDVFTNLEQRYDTPDFLTGSGRTLLSVGGGAWSSWDVATHRRTGSGRLPDNPAAAVSPDGRTVALTGTDGSRLWRLPTREQGPTAAGQVLAFTGDGSGHVAQGGEAKSLLRGAPLPARQRRVDLEAAVHPKDRRGDDHAPPAITTAGLRPPAAVCGGEGVSASGMRPTRAPPRPATHGRTARPILAVSGRRGRSGGSRTRQEVPV